MIRYNDQLTIRSKRLSNPSNRDVVFYVWLRNYGKVSRRSIYAANFVGKCSQVSISRAVLRDQTHPQHFGGVMRIVFSHLGIVCVA